MRKGAQHCQAKNPHSGNVCRLEAGHDGAHRWWVSGKAPANERCGRKSERTELLCTVKRGHKGRHRYGPAIDSTARKEAWFSCEECHDQGFHVLAASIEIEVCQCSKEGSPAAVYHATAGKPGVQTNAIIPIRVGKSHGGNEMLVLSRKVEQAIRIGGSLVKVLKVEGNRVTLGIEADPKIGIWRSELLEEPEPVGDLVELWSRLLPAESFTDEPRIEVEIPIEWETEAAR